MWTDGQKQNNTGCATIVKWFLFGMWQSTKFRKLDKNNFSLPINWISHFNKRTVERTRDITYSRVRIISVRDRSFVKLQYTCMSRAYLLPCPIKTITPAHSCSYPVSQTHAQSCFTVTLKSIRVSTRSFQAMKTNSQIKSFGNDTTDRTRVVARTQNKQHDFCPTNERFSHVSLSQFVSRFVLVNYAQREIKSNQTKPNKKNQFCSDWASSKQTN